MAAKPIPAATAPTASAILKKPTDAPSAALPLFFILSGPPSSASLSSSVASVWASMAFVFIPVIKMNAFEKALPIAWRAIPPFCIVCKPMCANFNKPKNLTTFLIVSALSSNIPVNLLRPLAKSAS